MNRSMPGLPVYHQLSEFTQTHVHQVGDAIHPSHPLSFSSPPSIRVFSNESTLCMRWPKYWSFSFSISPSNEHPIALISQASKVLLKILQARLQQYMNSELPDVQAGIRKGRGARDQITNIHCFIEKAREFQKNICFCFIDYSKLFVWITTNCGKFLKRWE